MKTHKELPIIDSLIIKNDVFEDLRGFFITSWEEYNSRISIENFKPVSLYFSHNKKYVLRGFHIQEKPFEQSKLVQCVHGEIYDVIVDTRINSPTYSKWYGTILNPESKQALYIPKGCAHAFISLQENSIISYLIEGEYKKKYASSFSWDDPILNINWPIDNPIISEKDSKAQSFESYMKSRLKNKDKK